MESLRCGAGGFRRAELNGDGRLDISDGITLLSFLFLEGSTMACMDAGDTNDDGTLDLSDPVTIFSYLFTGGKSIPVPFANCGQDPTEDGLDCELFNGC